MQSHMLRFACLTLLCLSVATGLPAAQADPTIQQAPADSTVADLVGDYVARIDQWPAPCIAGAKIDGLVRVRTARRGLLIHLEDLRGVFTGPVDVTIDGPGFVYLGPVPVRTPLYDGQAQARLVGQLRNRSLIINYEIQTHFCKVEGRISATWNRAPAMAADKPSPAPAQSTPEPPVATPPPPAAAAPTPAAPTDGSPASLVGQEVSFQASDYPDRFIRHRFALGYADRLTDDLARADATFRIVPGLAGTCISLESRNFPNHYLRHQDWRLRLAVREDQALYRQDATFCLVPGLAGGAGFSLEAAHAPGHFIRHRNNELWVDRFDGSDLNRRDATFSVTQPGGVTIVR